MGNSRFSDRWIEDGSYLRLKTITLSYDLPVNSTFFQGFQFWIQANNVFTITKYLGSDPEFSATSSVIGQGIDLGEPASEPFHRRRRENQSLIILTYYIDMKAKYLLYLLITPAVLLFRLVHRLLRTGLRPRAVHRRL